jgi:hypothetical protein
MRILRYSKALVAGALPVGALFVELAGDDIVTGSEWRLLGAAVFQAVIVWLVPNHKPDA